MIAAQNRAKPPKALKNGQFQEKPAKNLWKSTISH